MAKALKCDHCGKLFPMPNKNQRCEVHLIIGPPTDTYESPKELKQYDVCPECMDKLKQMFISQGDEVW